MGTPAAPVGMQGVLVMMDGANPPGKVPIRIYSSKVAVLDLASISRQPIVTGTAAPGQTQGTNKGVETSIQATVYTRAAAAHLLQMADPHP